MAHARICLAPDVAVVAVCNPPIKQKSNHVSDLLLRSDVSPRNVQEMASIPSRRRPDLELRG